MMKVITASLIAMAMGLAGCASSGPTYTARQLQLDNGKQAYQVTCYGLLENGNTCHRQAEKICAAQGNKPVHVLEGVSVVDHSKPEDERVLRFECGAPAQPVVAAPVAAVVPAPVVPATVRKISLEGDANFDTAKATLRPAATQRLDQLIADAQGAQFDEVIVNGYTDSLGSQAYNARLSQKRADAVAEYLSTHGLHAAKYSVHGYGEDQPVASNATQAGRAKNRRVEVQINS